MKTPGLGESQQGILDALKRRGPTTVPRLAEALGLNVETVRAHLRALSGHELVRKAGSRSRGRGRPELVYELTPKAEALFPRREGELLRRLARYLQETGNEDLLAEFMDGFIGERREEALSRVEGLEGRARLEEAARVLSDLGFMAELEGEGASPRLRLCHCPLRELVEETKLPCRAEIGFVKELLGEELSGAGGLRRQSYIPAGDASCSY
ncbi:MAG TPA: helix-turn-helix domain-containing protein, partial [Longimicrobiales bacterium]|nr:helix-turn-helix domain-containing protein [Longimicrobiales bacterium]